MALFADIPQFIHNAAYAVDVSWDHLPLTYHRYVTEYALDVNPDFQRGYVWTPAQKVRYVEFILRGGQSGRDILFNCPGWSTAASLDQFVLVDGKQRLDAVLGFLNNEFPVFNGNYRRDYTDRLRMTGPSFRIHVNNLETREEVLQWYLDLNSGGTVHSEEELARVRNLLGKPYESHPVSAELKARAGLDREIFAEVVAREAAQSAERAANAAALEARRSTKKGKK